MEDAKMDKPRVVIIGGGFGGLNAAQALAKAAVEITLVDRCNHHLFQPLLYQVATAALNPSDIAHPIRNVLRKQKNARVLLAEVVSIDTNKRQVLLDEGVLEYDYLVVATGATHSYFNNPEWGAVAPGLKTVEDALEIRRRALFAYEAAERETDPAKQAAWLNFEDFRAVDSREARVMLVEAQDRVLPSYREASSLSAQKQLEKLGVELRLEQRVTAIDEDGLCIGDERIDAKTVFWAAGVQASPLAKSLGVPLDGAGRVKVEQDLSIPGHPEVFVVGDLAAVSWEGGGADEIVPGVAPAAVQGARHAALSIRNKMKGKSTTAFQYRDKGSLATIGRAAAVAEFGRFRFSGFFAWLAWWAIHIFFLIGFRSRLFVMVGWALQYFTFRRGARLIVGRTPAQLTPAPTTTLSRANEQLQRETK
jgi:NADH dehydrogenase